MTTPCDPRNRSEALDISNNRETQHKNATTQKNNDVLKDIQRTK